MTTTLSQFIGSVENLSLSYLSTPGFKNQDLPKSINQNSNMSNSDIKDFNSQNSNQDHQKSKMNVWKMDQQVQDSKLFITMQEIKSEQNQQPNYHAFDQKISENFNNNKDCTPVSLLEKLRNYKYEKQNPPVKAFCRKLPFFPLKPQFSLMYLKNPAFRLLKDINEQRFARLTRSGLGWHDKSLYEDKSLGEFYIIPDETEVVDYVDEQNQRKKNIDKALSHNEQNKKMSIKGLKDQNLQIRSLLSKKVFFKKRKNSNKANFSSHTIMDNLITQSSIIEDHQKSKDHKNHYQSIVQKQLKQQCGKVDMQIQTKNQCIQIKEPQIQHLGKLSFQQLSDEIVKHLKLLEAINNSQLSEISANGNSKEQRIEQQQKFTNKQSNELIQSKNNQSHQTFLLNSKGSIFCQENQEKSFHKDESKYLRSSESRIVLTPAQKQKLLEKFNKEQKQMFQNLFQSMISSQCLENSQIQKIAKPKIQKQQRVFLSQIFHALSNQIEKQMKINQKEGKQSEINFQPPKDKQATDMTFLKKTYEDIISLSPSKIMNSSQENTQSQFKDNNGQFEKLEQLMRDRDMKKSILGSNAEDQSFNSESFLSIMDDEIAEKFKKFNPDKLKKDETQ